MRNWKRIWQTGMMVLAAVSLLPGCGVTEALSASNKGVKEYGKAETMVILTTERLRYEELYTEEIWNAAVDNRGTTFETVLLSQVHDFLINLKTMSDMADEQKITLTSREKELVNEAALQYYTALGSENAELFGLEKNEVSALYEDYWTAEKLVEQLTGGMNLEVSDSEAKVITVSQIELLDSETAEEVLLKVRAEGSDFNSVAKEYSADEEMKKQLHYGMMGSAYESAAFALGEGEISDVIQDGGKYYILKCVDDYDEEATRIRKEQMTREKKAEAFHSSYQAYKAENQLTADEAMWNEISVTESPKVEADFFETFEAVCKEPVS